MWRVIHRLWCPPSPLIEQFDIWGGLTPDSKLTFYSGWANGLFTTTKDPGTLALGHCLEKLSFKQILAMIDKRFADHREGFHNPISTELIEAVTVTGSPCEDIIVGSASCLNFTGALVRPPPNTLSNARYRAQHRQAILAGCDASVLPRGSRVP